MEYTHGDVRHTGPMPSEKAADINTLTVGDRILRETNHTYFGYGYIQGTVTRITLKKTKVFITLSTTAKLVCYDHAGRGLDDLYMLDDETLEIANQCNKLRSSKAAASHTLGCCYKSLEQIGEKYKNKVKNSDDISELTDLINGVQDSIKKLEEYLRPEPERKG